MKEVGIPVCRVTTLPSKQTLERYNRGTLNSPWVANNKLAKLQRRNIQAASRNDSSQNCHRQLAERARSPTVLGIFVYGRWYGCAGRYIYIVGSAVAPADARGFGSDAAGVLGLRESREPTDVRVNAITLHLCSKLTSSKLQKVSEREFLSLETYGLAGKTTGKTKRLNFTSSPVHLLWSRVL
ncbi:hypothetical protein V1478_005490 [Vespula squamosa]|uniref:Uncharacterized protein n=1 Tax=Vespula squamosa TaxID=30214 RepID=A0ABD2BE96_VESSQ